MITETPTTPRGMQKFKPKREYGSNPTLGRLADTKDAITNEYSVAKQLNEISLQVEALCGFIGLPLNPSFDTMIQRIEELRNEG